MAEVKKTSWFAIPIGDRLIARPIVKKEYGGLELPDDAIEPPVRAQVLWVGPDCKVEPGDVVLFNKLAAVSFELNEENLIVMREPDAYAVIKQID